MLKFHLQTDPALMEPGLDAPTFGVSAEQVEDWDEMPGSFPTQSARPGASVKEQVEMELSSDSNRWIIGEALASTTCKSQSKKKDLSHLAYRCNDKKTCPRCAAQHQIEGGYEDPQGYLDNAVYVLQSLEQYRTQHPNYETRRSQLVTSSYQWSWMVTESIKHNKSLSHYGACIIPVALVQKICSEKRLGDYFVQRRWNEDMRSFDYCLSLDPCNRHYYSWWRTNLENRGDAQ